MTDTPDAHPHVPAQPLAPEDVTPPPPADPVVPEVPVEPVAEPAPPAYDAPPVGEPAPVVEEPAAYEPPVEEPAAAAFEPAPVPEVAQEPAAAPEPVQETAPEAVAAAAPAVRSSGPAHVKKQHKSFLRELPFLVAIAFVLALLIKHFLVQAFYIPSGSMEQTLMVGDRVLVNKVPYAYRSPHRGEIVVFNGLDNFDDGVTFAQPTNPVAKALRKVSGTIGLGAPSERDYIKRVIGVAGDRVMCCDADGRVVVTPKGGQPAALDEPYVYDNDQSNNRYFCQAVLDGKPQSKETCPPGAEGILVPEGRLWVMGDHRGNSSDSRAHLSENSGTVPEDKVVGKAFTIVYPFGRAAFLHVPDTFGSVALGGAPYVLGAVGTLPLALVRRRRSR